MSESSGDRAHPASPIRLDQARRDGDIPKSFELATAIQLLGGLGAVFALLGGIGLAVKNWTQSSWAEASISTGDATEMIPQLQSNLLSLVFTLAPFLVLIFLLSVLSHWCQTGLVFRPQHAAPDVGRLSLVKWWERLFSFNTMAVPLIGFPKSLVIFFVAGLSLWFQKNALFGLGGKSVEAFVSSLFGVVLAVAFQVAVALFCLALIDYAMKRWSFSRRMQMSDQQLRDELRMQNGDPAVNQRRREVHRSFSTRV